MKPSCLILSLVLSFVSLAWAVEATQDDYGAPAVEVRRKTSDGSCRGAEAASRSILPICK